MIDWTWIRAAEDAPLMIVCSAVAPYVLLILYTRLVGLRSSSKMSSLDFAITIAIGRSSPVSRSGRSPRSWKGPWRSGCSSGCNSWWQSAQAASRRHPSRGQPPAAPHGRPRGAARQPASVQHDQADLRAKLCEANVTRLEQVRAVVMESTGNVLVFHAPPDAPAVDDALLEDVQEEPR